jgi:AsmA family protein
MSVTERESLCGHGWSKAAMRERIVADFRDFQFTWRGFFKWTATTLLGIVIGALFALYFLDWNQMRAPIGRWLSHRTGREVRIDGNLAVKLFSWQPSAEAGGIYIGNPAWVGTRQAASVKDFRIEIRLVPLFWGHLIVPLVKIVQPDVTVVRDAGGRTNWDNGSGNQAWKLPPIQHFLIQDGHVQIDDAIRKLHFSGTVNSQEDIAHGGGAFSLTGNGTLNLSKFLADVKGGPLIHVDQSKPYDFTADVTAGTTHAVVHGSITEPFHMDRYTATVNVSGPTLADLYFLTGVALPNTPAYHMTLAVERDDTNYRLNDIAAVLGKSDLHGNLQVDMSGDVPALAGRLASRVLALEDLGPLVRGGAPAPSQSRYLLPETPMHTERLRHTNAEVDYSAAKVASRDFPLTSLDTHISVQGGVLNLKPLAFGFTQGKLAGSVRIDARKDIPTSSVDARITDIRAENFIRGSDKPLTGMVEARAVLTGTGKSVHDAASNASGTVTAVVPSGGMRHSLAEWAGVDVLSALSLNLAGDNSNTNLRCAVANFSAKDGVMTGQQLVIDTDPVRIDGSGSINLRDETLDMKLQGHPKHFQLMRLRAGIAMKGPWAHPALGVDAGQALAQGGIALALGAVNPFAAILAFIDPGLAKDANCGPILADAKAKGAPVKQSAVKNAQAPRR